MPTTTKQPFSWFVFPGRTKWRWGDAVALTTIAALLYFGVRLALRAPAAIAGPAISLSPAMLPLYAGFSFLREFDVLHHFVGLQPVVRKPGRINPPGRAIPAAVARCFAECSDSFLPAGGSARFERLSFARHCVRMRICRADLHKPGVESGFCLVSGAEDRSFGVTGSRIELSLQPVDAISYSTVAVRRNQFDLEQRDELGGGMVLPDGR